MLGPSSCSTKAPALSFLMLLLATSALGQARQVVDLNPGPSPGKRSFHFLPADFESFAGAMYFSADDGIHGTELWRSDGTAEGSRMVADLCPGVCSSNPFELTVAGDRLFFVADDGSHGRELWVLDEGTRRGGALPRLVADLVPGLVGSRPVDLYERDGDLLFFARGDDGTTFLTASDGTAAGTAFLVAQAPGTGSNGFLGEAGGWAIFSGWDDATGIEPWRTDGTVAGTGRLRDIHPGPAHSLFGQAIVDGGEYFAPLGDRLLFAASADAFGPELWITDGTPVGTVPLVDLEPGFGGSHPWSFEPCLGQVFFRATVDGRGALVASDGTPEGTAPVVSDLGVLELQCAGDRLFFSGADDDSGYELWTSDGSAEGTARVVDLRPGEGWGVSYFSQLDALGNRLFFYGDDGIHGFEPWVSDGTGEGTLRLGDLAAGSWPSLIPLWSLNAEGLGLDRRDAHQGLWYFRAWDTWGREDVWVTDGTPAGTRPLEIHRQSSAFGLFDFRSETVVLRSPSLAAFRGEIFFSAEDGTHGSELWSTDGRRARLVADLLPGPESSVPGPLLRGREGFLFGALTELSPRWVGGLFTSDGSTSGTRQRVELQDSFAPYFAASWHGRLLVPTSNGLLASDGSAAEPEILVGGWTRGIAATTERVFFATGLSPQELGVWDGEQATVIDLREGTRSSSPQDLAAGSRRAYFTADDGESGREPWVSDGTVEGTRRLADIRPGAESGALSSRFIASKSCRRSAARGDRFFFVADQAASGRELWFSNGTPETTALLADLRSGPLSSDPCLLTFAGDRLYFVADDGVHGRELWISDGSAAGTSRVTDLAPGPASSLPLEALAIGKTLYFSAHTPAHGRELWSTTGTAAGTRRLTDIAPGPLPSSPMDLLYAQGSLWMVATDGTTGFELWTLPLGATIENQP